MKVINHEGVDVTKDYEEQIAIVKAALKFYCDGKHFEWQGCHCHGHNVILDRGGEADTGINALSNLEWILKGDNP